MTALITGMSGFVGRHLAELLRSAGHEVEPLDVAEKCSLGKSVDLLDPATMAEVVQCIAPDRIFHLAAQSSVALAWKDPDLTRRVNVEGTLNLLQVLQRHMPHARVLLVSSASVYGKALHAEHPVRETDTPLPDNPYTESKLAAEDLARQFHSEYGLDVRIVRPLGHTGPGQRRGFVVPDFASQVARIAAGKADPKLRVGNLNTAREFSDVRDVVRAYQTILEHGEPGALYNLAANESHTIREVAETLLDLAGVSAELAVDPDLLRPTDESSPRLDTARVQALGFTYQIPFRQTLADVLAQWRDQVAQ